MPRPWVWSQLVIGWLPIWALLTVLLVTAHPEVRLNAAALISARMVLAAALLGPVVARVVRRVPWPHPVRIGFVALHLAAALAYGGTWVATNSLIESLVRGQAVVVIGAGLGGFIVLGVWLYVMNAGVLYATEASTRAARAEVAAVQSQLAALRGQLNPHFLFNALHTVVQLAPRAPDRAATAAEGLASLLRTSIEEERDLVPLADEWRFVGRYLDLERMRFGDRLQVDVHLASDTLEVPVPAFSLQCLVENAVRHGAAPRVEPTTLRVHSGREGADLVITVEDSGSGDAPPAVDEARGTGLRRLRERLDVLYRGRGSLVVVATTSGVQARLRLPLGDA